MLAENKKKYADFQASFQCLMSTQRQDKIRYTGNDKMFVAAYEPEYPAPSNRDLILTFGTSSKRYMLFMSDHSGCVVNSEDISDVREYLQQYKLNKFK